MTKKKILVIDDDARLTRMLELYFNGTEEYQLKAENKAENALLTIQQYKPQLILLDIMMPHLDGGDLAGMIRNLPGFSDVPIIYLTGAVSKREVEVGGGMIGGEPFIAKPFDFNELTTRISQYV